jgi:hypothetical protein
MELVLVLLLKMSTSWSAVVPMKLVSRTRKKMPPDVLLLVSTSLVRSESL